MDEWEGDNRRIRANPATISVQRSGWERWDYYNRTAIRNAGTWAEQGGGHKKVEGNGNLWKTKKMLPIIRPVTRSAGGSLEKCVGHSFWAPLSQFFASPGVPTWLGPANYACYSSAIMLTSKIIKQTIANLFQFDLDKSQHYLWKDTFTPVVPHLKGQGFNATAVRRPCLPLSAVTVLLHYLPRCLRSRVTCDKTPNIVTWSEHLLPCYCYTIKTNSKTIHSQVWQLDPAGSSVAIPKV